MFSTREKLIAVAIIVFAAALRFRGIERWSLNNDEISEARWSARSFSGMMQEVRRDAVHPPLDYIVQHFVGRIGPPWIRRVPPVLFGVATVALIIFLGAFWYSPAAGLAAGFLLSISPNHVRHSQEVRPYSMGIFFVLAALVALELYARSGRRRWAVVWFGSVFLAGATLYLAGMLAFVVSATRILIGCRKDLATLWRQLPLMIIAWQVLYVPWLGVIAGVASSPSTLPAERLDHFWWTYRAQVLGTGDWIYEPVSRGSLAFWIAVALGILVSIRSRRLLVATSWFVGGAALTILLLHIHPHFQTPRYFLPAWVGAFLLAGSGIVFLWKWIYTRPVAMAIIVMFAGFSAITLQSYYHGERPNWRGVAQYVHYRAVPGDAIITANNWVDRNFGYYWEQMPQRQGLVIDRFHLDPRDLAGPAWIVTGQCSPRPSLAAVGLMQQFPMTELAEVRYLRPGQRLSLSEELCPE